MITNARYGNGENTSIIAMMDGVSVSIPVDEGNRAYRKLIEDGVVVGAFVPKPDPVSDKDIALEHILNGMTDQEKQSAKDRIISRRPV